MRQTKKLEKLTKTLLFFVAMKECNEAKKLKLSEGTSVTKFNHLTQFRGEICVRQTQKIRKPAPKKALFWSYEGVQWI